MKVVELRRAPVANQSVIESLENMLVKARSGEIQGLLAVCFQDDGRFQWSAGIYSAADALWALEKLKVQVLEEDE